MIISRDRNKGKKENKKERPKKHRKIGKRKNE